MNTPKVLREVCLEYANSYRLASTCQELLLPHCEEDVIEAFRNTSATASFPILGHGSNVILTRSSYPRIMKISRRFGSVKRLNDNLLYVDAGASLYRVALACEEFGLGGFEYLGNIPGSVGGGVVMNAGAFGHEIATVTQRVRVYAIRTQQVIELSHAECRWGYRSSLFQNEEYVVLGAYFRLHNADRKYLRASRLSNLALRRARYPRSQPNAGSVFKRPPHGLKVGEMIETLGHKGYSIGTAEISDKHAGFIVAKRPAQASDICALIAFMQREMRQHFDVETEVEQKLL